MPPRLRSAGGVVRVIREVLQQHLILPSHLQNVSGAEDGNYMGAHWRTPMD